VFRGRIRRPSHATVVAYLALFVALGGSVYAASHINGRQIRRNSLPGNRLRNHSVRGRKIKLSTLGTVPSAAHAFAADKAAHATNADQAANADQATNADQLGGAGASAYVQGGAAIPGGDLAGTYSNPTLKPPEASHAVGLPGNPLFQQCNIAQLAWANDGGSDDPARFYRDPLGTVHLNGSVSCPSTPTVGFDIFVLPAGYTPSRQVWFATPEGTGTGQVADIEVTSAGDVTYATGSDPAGTGAVRLDGITFRCSPSGSNGCP